MLLCYRCFSATPPLSCLLVHDQGDVALDQGEGEEADVAGVLAGGSGLLWPAEKGTMCPTGDAEISHL